MTVNIHRRMASAIVIQHSSGCIKFFMFWKNVTEKCLAKIFVLGRLRQFVFVTFKLQTNSQNVVHRRPIVAGLIVGTSCLSDSLAQRTKAARTSFSLSSVTVHLPELFPLQMQPASLKNFRHFQTDVFIGGYLSISVRDGLCVTNTYFLSCFQT